MTITYEEALSTLQSMFTSYTPQQLDAVLRHHNGHMENTVETILGHQGTPEELTERLKRGLISGDRVRGAGGTNIDADEELARQLAREDQQQHQQRQQQFRSHGENLPPGQRRLMSSNVVPPRNTATAAVQSSAAREKTGRGTATTLPVDFLRIPGRKYPQQQQQQQQQQHNVGHAGGMTDEQLARMLQDELFQEELRNNPEFSHLAGRRHAQMTGRSTYSGAGGGGGGPNWEEIGNRLSELGDTAKRRFQEIAANWSDPNRRNRNTQRQTAQTTERRGLLSNTNELDMEEEMDFVGGASSTGEAVELRDVSRDVSGAGNSGGIDWSGNKKKD